MVLGSGGSGRQIAAALATSLAEKQTEICVIDSLDDIEPDDGDVLICDDEYELNANKVIAYCGHPSLNIGALPECYTVLPDKQDNAFRGGSRGKGGKIKYTRK